MTPKYDLTEFYYEDHAYDVPLINFSSAQRDPAKSRFKELISKAILDPQTSTDKTFQNSFWKQVEYKQRPKSSKMLNVAYRIGANFPVSAYDHPEDRSSQWRYTAKEISIRTLEKRIPPTPRARACPQSLNNTPHSNCKQCAKPSFMCSTKTSKHRRQLLTKLSFLQSLKEPDMKKQNTVGLPQKSERVDS